MRSSPGRLRTCMAGLAMAVALGATPALAAGIHIDNFGQVNQHYYRGAQPKGDDFKSLAALGVKMIIDLAGDGDSSEQANSRAAGMRFARIPMTTHQVPSAAVIAQFLSLVNNPANQPVYVHCIGGRHRTGVMTAIYRMTMDGWTAGRAYDEMKRYHFGADFLHPEFKAFIDTYVVPDHGIAAARPGAAPGNSGAQAREVIRKARS